MPSVWASSRRRSRVTMKKKTLVVDIGGTHVKLMVKRGDHREFDSGPKMRPKEMVAQIKENTCGWNFDTISIGFPAPVRGGKIARDPKHLGPGWVGFDFRKALGKPVQVINDAAMQRSEVITADECCFS